MFYLLVAGILVVYLFSHTIYANSIYNNTISKTSFLLNEKVLLSIQPAVNNNENNGFSSSTSPDSTIQTIFQKSNLPNNLTDYVFITSAIDGNGNQLTNNATTTSRSITFHFENRTSVVLRCTIDGSVIQGCTSPITLDNLVIDNHLFEVRADVIFYDCYPLPNGTPTCTPGGVAETDSAIFHWRVVPHI